MEIAKGIEIRDLGLLIGKTLIIADIHMGFEEAANNEGVLIPRSQYRDTIKRLKKILENIKVETIIINGDLKHEFGAISETEWRDTLSLLDFLLENCERIILIKGNHDTILGPIAEKRGIDIVENYELPEAFICHGNKIMETENSTIIIGHEHPAVTLREEARQEKYKCFLKGKWKGKSLIVMPSFNLVREGSDMLKEERLSPYLKDISDFEAYVIDEERGPLYFGKINELKP